LDVEEKRKRVVMCREKAEDLFLEREQFFLIPKWLYVFI
jgi:hypothetical protein